MDDSRFDAIARFAGRSDRRTALRLLAAGSLGVAVLQTVTEVADAKCVNPGGKCKRKKGKKRKCCGGATCQGKRCVCPANTTACGAFCCTTDQVCVGEGSGATCEAKPQPPKLKLGDACSAQDPTQCESGKCGCNGQLCACREANCKAPNVGCAGSLACCNGVCVGNQCSA